MWSPAWASVKIGQRRGRLPTGHDERPGQADRCGDAALQAAQPGLQRTLRRVHDPGVDVADLGQGEQVLGVRRVAERI